MKKNYSIEETLKELNPESFLKLVGEYIRRLPSDGIELITVDNPPDANMGIFEATKEQYISLVMKTVEVNK